MPCFVMYFAAIIFFSLTFHFVCWVKAQERGLGCRGADIGADRGAGSGADRGAGSGVDRGAGSGADRGSGSGVNRGAVVVPPPTGY